MPGCRRKHRSSRPTPLDPPILVWQLTLPTSGECLTGRPTSPTIVQSSLLMVLACNPAYLQCPSRSWASLRHIQILAFSWAGAYIASSCWALVKGPQDSQWGLLTKDVPSSGLRKVTCLSHLFQLRYLSCLSRDLSQWWLWLQGCWH